MIAQVKTLAHPLNYLVLVPKYRSGTISISAGFLYMVKGNLQKSVQIIWVKATEFARSSYKIVTPGDRGWK